MTKGLNRYLHPFPTMDKVVKVMLGEEAIGRFDTLAKGRGILRMYLLREILEGYLSGPRPGPSQVPPEDPGKVAVLNKALEDTQQEREIFKVRVADLERALADRTNDLEYTRGQWQALNANLTEALLKIPSQRPLLEESGKKVSWWGRLTGKTETDQPNP